MDVASLSSWASEETPTYCTCDMQMLFFDSLVRRRRLRPHLSQRSFLLQQNAKVDCLSSNESQNAPEEHDLLFGTRGPVQHGVICVATRWNIGLSVSMLGLGRCGGARRVRACGTAAAVLVKFHSHLQEKSVQSTIVNVTSQTLSRLGKYVLQFVDLVRNVSVIVCCGPMCTHKELIKDGSLNVFE